MVCYITYGPISLEGVVLKSMKCDTIMSDDKLTVRYKRWTIQFAAHCNTNMNRHLMVDRIANPANVQKGGSGLGIDTAEAVLFWLSQPRQFFRLEYDGETIIGFYARSWQGNGFQLRAIHVGHAGDERNLATLGTKI